MSRFTWGTVTAVSPLRVQLDGDPAALPLVPDTLVQGMLVGDRVRCELTDSRRVVVHGRARGGGPVGEHIFGEWSASALPADCVLANGAVLSIASYPRLAAHYASVYGAANHHGGDGITTFAVPDTRERTYVNQGGADIFAVLGATLGAKTHTLTSAQVPQTSVGLIGQIGAGNTAGVNDTGPGGASNPNRFFLASAGAPYPPLRVEGGGQAHPIIQPSFVCRVAIRAR